MEKILPTEFIHKVINKMYAVTCSSVFVFAEKRVQVCRYSPLYSAIILLVIIYCSRYTYANKTTRL